MSPSGTSTASSSRTSLPLVAATAAVLPAVALSSLALAEPAQAGPFETRTATGLSPTGRAGYQVALIPVSEIAALVPSRFAALEPVPNEYTVRAGDTVWDISRRFNLNVAEVLTANSLGPNALIFPGDRIKLTASSGPAPAAAAGASPTTTGQSTGGAYTIRPGDTLYGISARLNVPIDSLLAANGIRLDSTIFAGRTLQIPGARAEPPAAATPQPRPQAQGPAAPAPAATGSYTIRPGDTLYGISARLNVPISSLLAANGLSITSIIYAGRMLTIPGAQAPAPASTASTTSAPLVADSFLGYKYPEGVVSSANENKRLLNSLPAPSPAQMKQIVSDTARSMGVDPSLALAIAFQESSFNQRSVSPANAIGTMQIIPSSGQWASTLLGRKLNLLDPNDNAAAGIAIIRALLRTSKDEDTAIASYYQGQYSVTSRGLFDDTKAYLASVKAHRKTFS